MKRIKFKGNRISDNKTVVGYPIKDSNGKSYIGILHDSLCLDGDEVNPESIKQFICKERPCKEYMTNDRKLKDIYEGDKVRCYGGVCFDGFWGNDKTIIAEMTGDFLKLIEESDFVEKIND